MEGIAWSGHPLYVGSWYHPLLAESGHPLYVGSGHPQYVWSGPLHSLCVQSPEGRGGGGEGGG